MKFDKKILEKRWAANALAGCIVVLFYLIITNLTSLRGVFHTIAITCLPVIIAALIAYVIDPLVTVYKKTLFFKMRDEKAKRTISVILALVTVVLGIVFLLIALVPQLVDSVVTFVGNFESYAATLEELLHNLELVSSDININISDLVDWGTDFLNNLAREIPQNFNRIINTSYNIGKGVFLGVISFILAIYFLMDRDDMSAGMGRFMRALLPTRNFNIAAQFWGRCNSIMVRYIACDLLDGLIIGFANYIFMRLFSMSYGVLISVVVGVTNLAPTFGPVLGAVIGAFILVLINPWHALLFLVFTIGLQTVDGYILKPRLFGGQLGVSSLWILICIIMGSRMFGIPGILLSIPFAAISDYLYHELLFKLESRRRSILASEDAEANEPEKKDSDGDELVKRGGVYYRKDGTFARPEDISARKNQKAKKSRKSSHRLKNPLAGQKNPLAGRKTPPAGEKKEAPAGKEEQQPASAEKPDSL